MNNFTYAEAVNSPQAKLKTQEKRRGKYSHRYEISWINNEEIKTEEQETEHMVQTLRDVLRRAKKVDRKAMINYNAQYALTHAMWL